MAKFPDDSDSLDTNIYREGKGVDPISGAEAVISHLISKFLKVPCAHAPALNPIELNIFQHQLEYQDFQLLSLIHI